MSIRIALWWERALGAFKYLVAVFMMFAGVLTATGPLHPRGDGSLGFIYASRIALAAFGIWFFVSGAVLFYGKIRKRRLATGWGLLLIFNCFFFSGILNTSAAGFFDYGNFIAAGIMGALYLRWRFKTAYVNPRHFVSE